LVEHQAARVKYISVIHLVSMVHLCTVYSWNKFKGVLVVQ